MASNFRTLRRWLAPRWLTTGDGFLVGYSLDLLKDAFMRRMELATLARFPFFAPPDALAALGRDRKVVRGINESAASYQARLIRYLDDCVTKGNPFTLMQKLSEYCGAGTWFRTVDVRGNWFTLAVDGTRSFVLNQGNWDWDESAIAGRWSKFWVVIYPAATLWTQNAPWSTSAPASWADIAGATWDWSATPDQVASIRGLIAEWKPGGTRCVNIIVSSDPTLFDPTEPEGGGINPDGHFWREYKSVSGVATRSRFAAASYWSP